MQRANSDLLRGTLKTIVLRLLSDRERMYGYEITQSVKERTKGELILTFGALYPVLHKLEQEGFVLAESAEVDGRLRKYYSLTPSGTETARQKISEFEQFFDMVRALMQSSPALVISQ